MICPLNMVWYIQMSFMWVTFRAANLLMTKNQSLTLGLSPPIIWDGKFAPNMCWNTEDISPAWWSGKSMKRIFQWHWAQILGRAVLAPHSGLISSSQTKGPTKMAPLIQKGKSIFQHRKNNLAICIHSKQENMGCLDMSAYDFPECFVKILSQNSAFVRGKVSVTNMTCNIAQMMICSSSHVNLVNIFLQQFWRSTKDTWIIHHRELCNLIDVFDLGAKLWSSNFLNYMKMKGLATQVHNGNNINEYEEDNWPLMPFKKLDWQQDIYPYTSRWINYTCQSVYYGLCNHDWQPFNHPDRIYIHSHELHAQEVISQCPTGKKERKKKQP